MKMLWHSLRALITFIIIVAVVALAFLVLFIDIDNSIKSMLLTGVISIATLTATFYFTKKRDDGFEEQEEMYKTLWGRTNSPEVPEQQDWYAKVMQDYNEQFNNEEGAE